MLSIPRSVRILLAAEPTDMRKSIDGLCAIVKSSWREDVFAGNLFAFLSRRGDRVKVLTWESGGFALYYKRLEKGRFRIPQSPEGTLGVSLDGTQLAMLLDGIDTSRVRRPARWTPPTEGDLIGSKSVIKESRWPSSLKTTTARGEKRPSGSGLGARGAGLEPLQQQVVALQAQLEKLTRHIFGKRSEKLPRVAASMPKPSAEEAHAKTQALRQANAEVKKELPQRQVQHVIDEVSRKCPK